MTNWPSMRKRKFTCVKCGWVCNLFPSSRDVGPGELPIETFGCGKCSGRMVRGNFS